ncbi:MULTISPECIES: hypothetical protein [unclassified Roseateles]|uniref:hypothetical protein n=1 Tax=unclassified Roseateles TaxID=2626991 RepID=UPI000712C6A3|nr:MULTISPECIES: hypothetical protein [unclassified Roseateles]KQW42933.1 hypothetical protein ASC81_19985 [Pelomonas sp. Root405]KRA69611.1 hypothetical protein ASD88_20635 [Pelomonas sp. Root662]
MNMKPIFLVLVILVCPSLAFSQETRVYLKEAHIIVSLAASGSTPDGLQIRGLNHKDQRINVAIYGLESLQGGKQVKADCGKFFAMANAMPKMRMELYVSGMAPSVAASADPRGYRAITFQVTGQPVTSGCVLADSTKFNDQTSSSVIWYEFP